MRRWLWNVHDSHLCLSVDSLSLRNLTESSPALGPRHEIYNRELRPVDDQHNDDEAEFITCVVFSIFCAMYILRDEGRAPRSTLAHSVPLSAAFPTGQLYACIIFHTNKTDRICYVSDDCFAICEENGGDLARTKTWESGKLENLNFAVADLNDFWGWIFGFRFVLCGIFQWIMLMENLLFSFELSIL